MEKEPRKLGDMTTYDLGIAMKNIMQPIVKEMRVEHRQYVEVRLKELRDETDQRFNEFKEQLTEAFKIVLKRIDDIDNKD